MYVASNGLFCLCSTLSTLSIATVYVYTIIIAMHVVEKYDLTSYTLGHILCHKIHCMCLVLKHIAIVSYSYIATLKYLIPNVLDIGYQLTAYKLRQ